jgi:hypothetical protein
MSTLYKKMNIHQTTYTHDLGGSSKGHYFSNRYSSKWIKKFNTLEPICCWNDSVGAPDLAVVCHGPSKVDRLAEQQSISKTSWAAASGGAELIDSLDGWDDYYPTVQTARGRHRDSATTRLVPLRAERPQPESAAATTKSWWSHCRATTAGEGGSRACRQSRRMGRLLPHRPNSAWETERFSDGTARPPQCRASPARIGGSNHKITVELLSCNYGRRGAWKIRSSLLQKNQQRTLVLPSSVI